MSCRIHIKTRDSQLASIAEQWTLIDNELPSLRAIMQLITDRDHRRRSFVSNRSLARYQSRV